MTRLAPALAFVGAVMATRSAVASPISELAASMRPGTWAELETEQLDATMAAAGASGIKIPYSDDLVWDPNTHRAFFVGGDHADIADHLRYDGASNTWSTLPRPTWIPGGTSHGYDHSALDPTRGLLYHRPFYDNGLHRYDTATETWSDIPSPPDNGVSCCDALEYFPPLDALVWAHHSYGEVWAFGEATGEWTLLGTLPPGDTWQVAAYNPVGESMVFVYDGLMHRLLADGTIETLGPLGAPVYDGSGYNGVFTVDPTSGVYLVSTPAGKGNRTFWAFDDAADTWSVLPEQPSVDLAQTAMVAAPIAEYGVTMFTYCYGNTPCGVLLYKHSPFQAPPDDGGESTGGDGTTGGSGTSDGPGTTGGDGDDADTSTSADPATGDGAASTTDAGEQQGESSGCGCRVDDDRSSATVLIAGLFLLALRRRRCERALAMTMALGACNGDDGQPGDAGAAASTTSAATTVADADGSSSSAPPPADSTGESGGTTGAADGDSTGGDEPVDPADFDGRCAAPGVLVCVGFDDPADLAGTFGDNHGTLPGAAIPEIDPTTKASGTGALRFTIPSNSPANSSGSYFTNFSEDLSVQFDGDARFFVQWRQRFSPELLSTYYDGGGGWKQAIIGVGDQPGCSASSATTIDSGGSCSSSCTELETVVQNTGQRGFAQMYNSCTGSTSHGAYDPFEEPFGDYDFALQNARPDPHCLYSQSETGYFPPAGNCLGYAPDEWMTFQVEVSTGPRVGDEFVDSEVRLWIARQGAPSELVLDWGPYNLTAGDPATNLRFGKVWLLPYHTDKSDAQAHATATTWYDELIVSTERIADPA
jgi:MYXO-CTERM domain-containing protein